MTSHCVWPGRQAGRQNARYGARAHGFAGFEIGIDQPPKDIARALVEIGKARGPVVKQGARRDDAHGSNLGGDGAVVMGGLGVSILAAELTPLIRCDGSRVTKTASLGERAIGAAFLSRCTLEF